MACGYMLKQRPTWGVEGRRCLAQGGGMETGCDAEWVCRGCRLRRGGGAMVNDLNLRRWGPKPKVGGWGTPLLPLKQASW